MIPSPKTFSPLIGEPVVEELAAQGADEAFAGRVHARSLDGGTQDSGAGGPRQASPVGRRRVLPVDDNGGASLLADEGTGVRRGRRSCPASTSKPKPMTACCSTTTARRRALDRRTATGGCRTSQPGRRAVGLAWQTVIAGTFIGNIAPVATSDLVAYSRNSGSSATSTSSLPRSPVTDLRGIWTDGGPPSP